MCISIELYIRKFKNKSFCVNFSRTFYREKRTCLFLYPRLQIIEYLTFSFAFFNKIFGNILKILHTSFLLFTFIGTLFSQGLISSSRVGSLVPLRDFFPKKCSFFAKKVPFLDLFLLFLKCEFQKINMVSIQVIVPMAEVLFLLLSIEIETQFNRTTYWLITPINTGLQLKPTRLF